MADDGTFAATAEVQRKVGEDASATANAEAYINQFILEAESRINVESLYNWTDNYGDLNADVKSILKEAASNLAAIYVINYSLKGFTSQAEAETRMDVLYQMYLDCIKLLREDAHRKYMEGA